MEIITTYSSVNIALVKYWGKLSQEFNIPTNSSLSLTLTNKSLFTRTTISHAPIDQKNTFTLYEKSGKIFTTEFPASFLLIYNFFKSVNNQRKIIPPDNFFFKIETLNSFPTEAGMASSASGICCLVLSFARIVNFFEESNDSRKVDIFENISEWFEKNDHEKISKVFSISIILRMSCGSSCRSIYPGLCYSTGPDFSDFLIKNFNPKKYFLDKYSIEIQNSIDFLAKNLDLSRKKDDTSETYTNLQKYYHGENWNLEFLQKWHRESLSFPVKELPGISKKSLIVFFRNLSIVNIVVDQKVKEINSKKGMNLSISSSQFFPHRIEIVHKSILNFFNVFVQNNFHLFFELVMKESNNFHAVLQDTYPPIFFLSEKSKKIIKIIHKINMEKGSNFCGYTFDGGCNPFLFVLNEHKNFLIEFLKKELMLEDEEIYESQIKGCES